MSHQSSSSIFALGFAAALAVALAACAQGAEGTGDDEEVDAARIDAPNNPNVDARVDAVALPDARMVDAPISLPDAPIGLPDGGLPGMCTSNADCTAPGTCCLLITCVSGTPLPPPLNCVPS
ncbi:MAG: hypothetical protein KBG48_16710 [Kofleriaceae bacterium]|nr:hypothetical protein [Kofleriaceae bacterium]MBP9169042.1 hypothetical protein [Kofleriaceae bacterium]MBP9861677.1 hypothetical protein [Kofleriaceae bacterium]